MVKFKFLEKFLKTNVNTNGDKKIKSSNTELEYLVSDSINSNNILNSNLKLLNEHLICNCCMEILKNPITLNCGHSTCQICLANWYLTSSNQTCITCRQEWIGLPKVNIMLKTTIENLMNQCNFENVNLSSNDIKNRSSNLKSSKANLKNLNENDEIIKKFEEKCKKSLIKQTGIFQMPVGVQNRMRRVNQLGLRNFLSSNFLLGIFSGLLITCSFLILIPKKKIPHNDLGNSLGQLRNKYFKKSEQWSSEEIQEWLYSLGPWTSEFSNAVYNLNMDGSKLMNLTDKILKDEFGFTNNFLRRLLLDSINGLKYCHLKFLDLWEFKNLNKFRVIFYGFMFSYFPRLTIFYTYYFNYEVAALFFDSINNKKSFELSVEEQKILQIHSNVYSKIETVNTQTNMQTLFSFYRFPFMQLKYIVDMYFKETNRSACFSITINCLILTFIDSILIIDLMRSLLASDLERLSYLKKTILKPLITKCTFLLAFYYFWNFIPNFILDLMFFYLIFFQVFFNFFALVKFFKNFIESIGHYFVRPINN